MAKFILGLGLFVSYAVFSNPFTLKEKEEVVSGRKVILQTEKLKKLKLESDSSFDDVFNNSVKELENALEEEKLYCAGESANEEGQVVAPTQRQLCMRKLKNLYIEAMETVFNLKKNYLKIIHEEQLKKLSEIQVKLKSDIEKNF